MKIYFEEVADLLTHLNATIDRVRELHKPVQYHGVEFCSVCSSDEAPESLTYPCPTIKALDGEQV